MVLPEKNRFESKYGTIILKKSKKKFFSEIFPKIFFSFFFQKNSFFPPKKFFPTQKKFFFVPKKIALREPNGAGSLFHGIFYWFLLVPGKMMFKYFLFFQSIHGLKGFLIFNSVMMVNVSYFLSHFMV